MRKRPSLGHGSHDRWLVSYADFITLLFSLFVVLFAFAKADQKKQQHVTASIDDAFRTLGIFTSAGPKPAKGAPGEAGTETPVVPMNIVMGTEVLSPTLVKDDLNRLRGELEQKLSNQVASHSVSIKMGRDGLIISLREAGFFESGSATPKPETAETLQQIANSLRKTPYDLRIEGHTDDIPIHTAEFDSNWELSSARATRVARLFLDLKAIPAQRVSAAGYAEFHPVAPNDTPEGRAMNRRVDLLVLPRTNIDLSAPGSPVITSTWHKITEGDTTPPPSK